MTVMRELVPELCNGCGLCIVACHGGGIISREGKIELVESDYCDFCTVCEAVCPRGAIRCYYIVVSAED
jgi:Pyruvate/2-oxoacid:ferredoxin oxidoreductase delta subunit